MSFLVISASGGRLYCAMHDTVSLPPDYQDWANNHPERLWLCLQVAHGYLQHVAFVTGGEVDDYGAFVELEDLLEIYDLSLPANRDSEAPPVPVASALSGYALFSCCPAMSLHSISSHAWQRNFAWIVPSRAWWNIVYHCFQCSAASHAVNVRLCLCVEASAWCLQ